MNMRLFYRRADSTTIRLYQLYLPVLWSKSIWPRLLLLFFHLQPVPLFGLKKKAPAMNTFMHIPPFHFIPDLEFQVIRR